MNRDRFTYIYNVFMNGWRYVYQVRLRRRVCVPTACLRVACEAYVVFSAVRLCESVTSAFRAREISIDGICPSSTEPCSHTVCVENKYTIYLTEERLWNE